ncbi:hypothetical protein DD592_27540, partial [Enterobacter cloacae complex sp. 2DZ2F20B]
LIKRQTKIDKQVKMGNLHFWILRIVRRQAYRNLLFITIFLEMKQNFPLVFRFLSSVSDCVDT